MLKPYPAKTTFDSRVASELKASGVKSFPGVKEFPLRDKELFFPASTFLMTHCLSGNYVIGIR
jgi:hypothetical protein